MQLIKIVNHGKNGVYLYTAIIKLNETYFFTDSVLLKDKKDKYKHDFLKDKLSKELNQYALNKYGLC